MAPDESKGTYLAQTEADGSRTFVSGDREAFDRDELAQPHNAHSETVAQAEAEYHTALKACEASPDDDALRLRRDELALYCETTRRTWRTQRVEAGARSSNVGDYATVIFDPTGPV